jgi:4-hydroxy-2-oxoheptanedioate aldolase
MYPRCDDAREARELVTWSKFHPKGKRGADSGNGDNPYCTMPLAPYVAFANEQTFLVAQIEDPSALDHVEEIAEVDGIDVLFFGPGDFGVLSGIPGQFDHPSYAAAIRRIGDAAERAGKAWGMPSPSLERTRELLDMGARFIAHGADIIMVKTGLEAIRESFAGLGFTFDRSL